MFNAPTWTLADQKFDTSYIKTDPDCTHLVAFAWKTAAGEDRFSSMVASTGDLDQDLLGTSVRQQCMNHISRMAKDEGVLEGSVTFDVRPL